MIERKCPITLLEAIPSVCRETYSIKFIGEGNERAHLENYIAANNLSQYVTLVGKVQRDEVTRYLDEAECFIMVSRYEAYGLVYLEAMARGCIVIASRNEGFDGIIKDGENGFLCDAGNAQELSSIILYINSLSNEKRTEISENALATARKMTDYLMAKQYIEHLESIR